MAEMKQFGIDLELDDAVAQGHYSNLAIISHSTSEFIIDFATVLPGVQKARVKSRIILTPEHAKRLLRSLQENIVRYESNVGKIEIPSPQPTPDAGPKMGQAASCHVFVTAENFAAWKKTLLLWQKSRFRHAHTLAVRPAVVRRHPIRQRGRFRMLLPALLSPIGELCRPVRRRA